MAASVLLRRLADGTHLESIEAAKALAWRNARELLPEVADILLHGASPHAREMAAWLLGELSPGTDVTLEALHATIGDPEAPESLRGQAIESLGNQVSHLTQGEVYERAADALLPLLHDRSIEIRYNAVYALGAMRCRRARRDLMRIAGEDHHTYKGLQTISECAQFSIEIIDREPHGR